MNVLEKLLKADVAKVTEKPQQKIEIKRLSKVLGSKFEITVQALDADLLAEISESHTEYTKTGKVKSTDNFAVGVDMIVNATVEPDLRNKELLKHFGCATPNDLVIKLFLAGEMGKISETISSLCGVEISQNEIDEEVKN